MPPRRAAAKSASAVDESAWKVENEPSQRQDFIPEVEESAPQAPDSEANGPSTAPQTSASPRSRPQGRTTSIRGRPAIAAPKFAGRRSQAARAELEKEAARKKAEQAQAAAAEAKKKRREQNRDGRGRDGGRGGRGRGGFMGDHHSRQSDSVMSGPFGSGQVAHDSHSRRLGGAESGGFGGGGGSSGFGGSRATGSVHSSGTGFKTEGGGGGGGPHVFKSEDGGYISSDDDEAKGRKHNIDDLQQVIDLTIKDNRESRHVFAPVRLKREPHKDRTIVMSSEAQTTREGARGHGSAGADKRKGKQREKDLEVVYSSQKPRRPTTYSSSDENEAGLRIKTELRDDADEVRPATPHSPTDELPANLQSPPSSPEARRRNKEKVKEGAKEIVSDDDEYPLPEMPKFQTNEEVTEWRQHYADLNTIRTELGRQVPKAPAPTNTDGEGDTVMADGEINDDPSTLKARRAEQVRSEHVYLLQFPPVLPDLVPTHVKPDPEASSDATMDVDEPSKVAEVKEEEDVKSTITPKTKVPSGYVGKLRIHKSGKAVLDWGGTSLVLAAGAEPAFLQSILIAKVPESKPLDEEAKDPEQEAVGIGLGQVRGKFVLTPNWDEILK